MTHMTKLHTRQQFFPVIHLTDLEQGLREFEKAVDANADGVFFIDHHGKGSLCLDVAQSAKLQNPSFYVGVNLLSRNLTDNLYDVAMRGLDAIWFDHAGVSSDGFTEQGQALAKMHTVYSYIDIYAGVAFKYQKPESSPEKAVLYTCDEPWIPCTSGPGTGYAADTDKIELMSNASSNGLALASGVDLENVQAFLPFVTHFFVASSISVDEHTLDFEKMSALAGKIHSFTR